MFLVCTVRTLCVSPKNQFSCGCCSAFLFLAFVSKFFFFYSDPLFCCYGELSIKRAAERLFTLFFLLLMLSRLKECVFNLLLLQFLHGVNMMSKSFIFLGFIPKAVSSVILPSFFSFKREMNYSNGSTCQIISNFFSLLLRTFTSK